MTNLMSPDEELRLHERPLFVCRIVAGDESDRGELIAYSTADALASFLDRLPERGRNMFAPTTKSLRRKHDDATRRYDRIGNDRTGRMLLTVPRYVGNPDGDFLFACYRVRDF